jgi:uncharacterized protein (UPF0335 family)
MTNQRKIGYLLFCLVVILFTIDGVWTAAGTYKTSTATEQLSVNAVTYQITVTQNAHGTIVPGTSTADFGDNPTFTITPDAGYHIVSITANGVAVTVTTPSGQSYQFSGVSTNGSLTATFAINTPSLGLVLAAVIIVAAMIFIYRLPENKYKNIAVLTPYEKQAIDSLKNSIEKIRSLEEEKKSLLLEIEELKKMSEAKATALECEVNALQGKVKSLRTRTLGSEISVEHRQKKCENKTFQV